MGGGGAGGLALVIRACCLSNALPLYRVLFVRHVFYGRTDSDPYEKYSFHNAVDIV